MVWLIGLITNPFIPVIWVNWVREPLAPASIIDKTELSPDRVWGTNFSISDFVLCQTSIVLSFFSSLVKKPSLKYDSIFSISFSASSMIFGFWVGIIKSSMPKETPESVEYSNPKSLILSKVFSTFSKG